MAEKWITAGVSVALAIIGLAAIAVLVSKQSQTPGVLTDTSNAFKNSLCAALSPIGVQCGNLIPSVNSTITFGGQPFTGGAGAGGLTFGL